MKKYNIRINDKEFTVDIETLGEKKASVKCNGKEYKVEYDEPQETGKTPPVTRKAAVPDASGGYTSRPAASAAVNAIKAPIPGLITQILVSEGDTVRSGQTVAKMEAMKMENNILASVDAKIKAVNIKVGDSVLEGDVLMNLEDV